MTASVQWLERTLDDSANRRISLPEGFLCADAVLRLCQNVTNGLHVNEKIVDRAIREYLPFLATENIMMEAVKRGGDRQELHEKIRQHSMAATARMKEGESCDLLDRLAADPAFGMTRAELDAVMEPSLYIGRCKEQVERLLAEYAPPADGRPDRRRRHQPVNTEVSSFMHEYRTAKMRKCQCTKLVCTISGCRRGEKMAHF